MILEEITIKSDRLYEGKVLNLRVDTVEIPGKKYSKREIIEVSGAAAVVPVLEDGRVVLIKQYRKPLDKVIYEIPAGKLEPGEEPRECAVRELREETGYTSGKMTYLNEIFSSPGYANEKIHLFVATELTPGETEFDETESIESELFTFEELEKMIERGIISDAKTIVGIFMARSLTDGGSK